MRLLIPIKDRQLAKAQVAAAIQYSSVPNVEVILLHVIEPPPVARIRFPAAYSNYLVQRKLRVGRIMDELETSLIRHFRKDQVARKLVIGEPSRAILSQVVTAEDVMILGQRERHPFWKLFRWSMCGALSKKLCCSVLISKSRPISVPS